VGSFSGTNPALRSAAAAAGTFKMKTLIYIINNQSKIIKRKVQKKSGLDLLL
jgi:hypothetical protein